MELAILSHSALYGTTSVCHLLEKDYTAQSQTFFEIEKVNIANNIDNIDENKLLTYRCL